MRILHLIDSIKPGGAENVMCNYIKICNELGDTSTIIGLPNSNEYELSLAQIAKIKYHLTDDILRNTDAIFIHSNHGLMRLIKHWWIIKRKNIKVIYIQHLNYSAWKFKILSKLINRICTDFIQITPITEKLIKRNIKISVSKITNFYINRYPAEQYSNIRKTTRKELKISDSIQLIMFSAIFKPGKGLPDFVKLASEFIEYPNYHFLVVGDGEESDYVKDYAYENLTWIGRKNDVEKYLIASDVYVFTSRFALEMMPMALIEAINVDLPCVAYPTEINNFLLNNHTTDSIDKAFIINREYSDSKSLVHYDKQYGINQLRTLLHSY